MGGGRRAEGRGRKEEGGGRREEGGGLKAEGGGRGCRKAGCGGVVFVGSVRWDLTLFSSRINIFLYLCSHVMTAFNPYMTLHKLFLNIKKRDICHF